MPGLLREQGCPVPAGARTVLARITALVENPTRDLPALLRQTVAALVEEVRSLAARVAALDARGAYAPHRRAASTGVGAH